MIAAGRLQMAVARLADDGFIAYPTETVWGLGACADRPNAVRRLVDWKGRTEDAPMSVLVASLEAAIELGCEVEGAAQQLAKAFWPGPLTLVVPCKRRFARGVEREDGALGLRCSSHPVAHALAEAVHCAGLGPLTSTSMNRSGEPPAADRAAAEALVADRSGDPASIDEPLILADADIDAGAGAPSSVVDCTRAQPTVLRVGAIDRERLETAWSNGARSSYREMIR
jgi:L-threonylcarbamoyladenylate synthase